MPTQSSPVVVVAAPILRAPTKENRLKSLTHAERIAVTPGSRVTVSAWARVADAAPRAQVRLHAGLYASGDKEPLALLSGSNWRYAEQMAGEFADVLAWLATLANVTGVALTEAMAKYAGGCPGCGRMTCTCPGKP